MGFQETDKAYIANTYERFNLEAVSGRGAVCTDINGSDYIDFSTGIGVNALGFCDDGWAKAVCEQAGKLQHISNLYYTEPMAKLAKTLCERTFAKKVFFCNSGAEANEGMIKAARKYSFDKYGKDRHQILSLENSFHGRTVTTLSATGQDVFHQYFDPFTDGFEFMQANNLEDLKDKVDDHVCGILIELVQGEGGVVPLKEDFVAEISRICEEKDILLMVDEVQTGMGRTGKLLCCEHYGITPDLVSLAKGLGGGLPIGAVLMGSKCEKTLGYGEHGTTFGGNPVACAGANEILSRLDQKLLDEVTSKGAYITEKVMEMPHVVGVEGKGMMLGISLEGLNSKLAATQCLENGLIILTAKAKLRMLPPLTISYDEIDEGLKRLSEVLSK
ncbi:aspartate aminotransferase family protein [Oscillospiraceae bacterium PP1C4]